jgi:hypothetical protein
MGVSRQRHALAAIFPREKDPRYPLDTGLGGSQSRSGRTERKWRTVKGRRVIFAQITTLLLTCTWWCSHVPREYARGPADVCCTCCAGSEAGWGWAPRTSAAAPHCSRTKTRTHCGIGRWVSFRLPSGGDLQSHRAEIPVNEHSIFRLSHHWCSSASGPQILVWVRVRL